VTVQLGDEEAARSEDVLAWIEEVEPGAITAAELDWLFDGPLGTRVVSVAEDGGRVVGVLAMLLARAAVGGREERVAFAVRALTHPAHRGRGIFSRLELRNEERAASAGATLALGFTNRLAGPILVGKLGWADLYRMRLWARPLRGLRRRSAPALPRLQSFGDVHERAWQAERDRWGSSLARDAEYLNWRYLAGPRDYRAFGSENGYAVVGHTVRSRVSAAVICDLVAPAQEQPGLLRRCLEEARGAADVAIAVPAPGQRRAFLRLGFVPVPRTIRVIGKPLSQVSPPVRWHFSLGDTDFL
jgi:GNAT superfamily N-acetyltransferase